MRFRFAFLVLPFSVAFAFGACNGESEGQPCDTRAGNGGNDDCQTGLVCTTGLANAQGARCCPSDRTTSTTPECALGGATSDASSAPPDSSSGDGTVVEASGDGGGTGDATGDTGSAGDAADGATATDGADGATE